MSAQEIVKIIEEAWRHIPYPGDDRLIPRPKQPKGACRDEHDYVAEFFAGKHWKDVTRQAVLQEYEGPPYACLSFMSPEAYRFYLAAFMVMALTQYTPDDMMCHAALDSLVPPQFNPELYEKAKLPGMTDATNPCSEANVKMQRTWWDERVSGLTAEQRQAVMAFLEYMAQTYGQDDTYDSSSPDVALRHWKHTST